MKLIKDSTHAFIVRIWIEHPDVNNAEPVWRGVIEQVSDGQRVYFQRLEAISAFFAKYLDEIESDIGNSES